jgi:trehalose/maltose hydrolase-like predicted phosphorylase
VHATCAEDDRGDVWVLAGVHDLFDRGAHAALLARVGRLAEALEMLRLTARIDLDDIGDMTAGGLRLAAMGSVWRTLALGFAGLRPVGDALAIDPVLAPGWGTLEPRIRVRDSRVRVCEVAWD